MVYADLQLHRRNPLYHLGELDLASYDKDYAPEAERFAARAAHLAAWPEVIDAAIGALASADMSDPPVVTMMCPHASDPPLASGTCQVTAGSGSTLIAAQHRQPNSLMLWSMVTITRIGNVTCLLG